MYKKISLLQAVTAAVESYPYYDEDHRGKIDIIVGDDLIVYGNPDMLKTVLHHLLNNSLRYVGSESDGKIVISITNEKGGHCIHVWDNGPGIHKDKLQILSEKLKGFGIPGGRGLSVCNYIMKQFLGSITCQSEHGAWTRIRLSFPKG